MGAGIGIGVGPGGVNVSGGVNIGGVGVGVSISAPAPSFVLPFSNWTPALFIPYRRSIGGIVAQVTIEEQHIDALQITDHPVEASAPVSDHAFALPQQVNITAGWSKAVAYDLSAESGVYGLLLSWQAALMPFDVITGKRHYSNMLIERLIVTTDHNNEYTLMAQIACRQVIIAQVSTTQVAQTNAQANPASTAPPSPKGDQPTTSPPSTTSSAASSITRANGSFSGNLASKGIDTGVGPSTPYT